MKDAAVTTSSHRASRMPGTLALAFALLTAAIVVMVGVTSFTSFDPPQWIRVATMAPLPFVFAASAVCAVLALLRRHAPGRPAAALVLDGLAAIVFVVMVAKVG